MSFFEDAQKEFDKRKKYYQKKTEEKRKAIYRKVPLLEKIDEEIKYYGFKAVAKALNTSNTSEEELKLQDCIRKKKEILKENGFSENDLEPIYYHKTCKDTGYVGNKMCNCFKKLIIIEKYKMSNLDKTLQKQNWQNFDFSLFKNLVDSQKGFTPKENIELVVSDLKNYADNFNRNKHSIYIYGDVGRGKTYLLNCIAKDLLDRNFTVIYQTAGRLFDFFRDYSYAFSQEKEKLKNLYDTYYSADLLIIDDLGSENQRDQIDRSILFDLVNDRISNDKPIIISTNYNPDLFREVYGKRINSRLFGNCITHEIFGEDLRIRGGYF